MLSVAISLIADIEDMEWLDAEANFYKVVVIAVVFVTAALVLRTTRELIPIKVRSTNRCEGCNYDLYANESGVCPECGRMMPARAQGRTGRRLWSRATTIATDIAMTEQDWLHVDDLEAMLRHLSGRVSERKYRLTECAFHRRFWHLLADERSRRAVEVAERYADRFASADELAAAQADADVAFEKILGACFTDGTPRRPYWGGAVSAAQHAARSMYDLHGIFPSIGIDHPKRFGNMVNLIWNSTAAHPIGDGSSDTAGHTAIKTEQSAEIRLLHDLFGNPFSPANLDAAWLTPAITSLAQTIYDQRSFERLPELANELELAACENRDIIEHCRGLGPHVRGCWVIDLLLGNK
ncbi:MAG TPA: hypothetical protein VH370_10810 [Humisphaera sp.]|jgi:hypothetical protein|nr:hypothetical protein [Humisphaera sp.]